MDISDLLHPDRVVCYSGVGSKKKLLEHITELLIKNHPQVSGDEIFESLVNREKLGSTGLGKGVAIPHGRIKSLDQPLCAFIKIDEPVDFDAPDKQPVDLVFALLVPEESTEEHLQVLSMVAKMFSDEEFCAALRDCQSDTCLSQLILQGKTQRISA